MVTVRVDFETIERGHDIFKCPSELHLDTSYQHIHSTDRKLLIESQPEAEENQRFLTTIESKLKIECTFAQLKQETKDNELAIGVLQSCADKLAKQLPIIDDFVKMATVISK